MIVELKPCPFCGGEVEETGGSCNYKKHVMTLFVACRKCGTKYQFEAGFKENPYGEAVEAWNRRVNND